MDGRTAGVHAAGDPACGARPGDRDLGRGRQGGALSATPHPPPVFVGIASCSRSQPVHLACALRRCELADRADATARRNPQAGVVGPAAGGWVAGRAGFSAVFGLQAAVAAVGALSIQATHNPAAPLSPLPTTAAGPPVNTVSQGVRPTQNQNTAADCPRSCQLWYHLPGGSQGWRGLCPASTPAAPTG